MSGKVKASRLRRQCIKGNEWTGLHVPSIPLVAVIPSYNKCFDYHILSAMCVT